MSLLEQAEEGVRAAGFRFSLGLRELGKASALIRKPWALARAGPVSPLFQPLAAWETPIFAQGSGQAVSFPLLGGGPFAGLDQGPTLPTSVTRRVHPRADWYPGVGEGSAGTQAPWVYTPAPPPISGRPPTAYLHLPQSPCREMKTTEPRSTPHI